MKPARPFLLLACLLSLGLVPTGAHAQDTVEDVAAFFEDRTVQPVLRREPSQTDHAAIAWRHSMNEAFHLGDRSLLMSDGAITDMELGENFPGLARLHGVLRTSFTDTGLDRDALKQGLLAFDPGEDWFARAVASDTLSSLYMRDGDSLLAARFAEAALNSIPDTLTVLVRDAQLMVANRMTALQTVSGNPDRMLHAMRTAREIKQELGAEFNRHEALTNYLLAFNLQRNHVGAETMVRMLRDEPVPEGTASGLYEVYYADLLNETGRYADALEAARMASQGSDPIILRRAKGEAMVAKAGLGQRAEALEQMQQFGFWDGESPTDKAQQSEGALHALALLAASDGDATKAVAFQNKRLDLMVGTLRRSNAADAASLISHLESTRERQEERKRALQNEARMNALVAKKRTQLSYALLVLVLLLGAWVAGLHRFMRYRERSNAERAALQEDALSAERMKTEFLGLINHELRTPLNGVIGISDAMIHHSKDPTIRKQAAAIQGCGDQLFDLIGSMIDMTTLSGGKMELLPCDTPLAPAIERQVEAWRGAAEAKGLTYTAHVAPELSHAVFADPERFEQCIKILLSNATRFTHQGRIHLHATAEQGDGTLDVTVVVADTGQGMTELVQSRLFKPFLQADSTMTRKYGGAGLSLAIGRMLAEMMGGTLVVESAVDRGSEFTLTVRLPLAVSAQGTTGAPDADVHAGVDADAADEVSAPAEPALPPGHAEFVDLLDVAPELFGDAEDSAKRAPAERPAPDPLDGLRLLVVEDMPSNQDVIRLMVEPHGCRCVAAMSGQEALDALGRQSFDAVLMDIRMPGMDGVETTRRIRALSGPIADVPVIVLTADAGSDTARLARGAGADMFLSKPVVARDLLGALRAVGGKRLAA